MKKDSEILNNLKKNKWNVLIVFIFFILFILYIVFIEGTQNIIEAFEHLDYKFFLVAIFCMGAYWFLEAVSLHIFLKRFYEKGKTFKDTFKISMIGQFFNSVTPFSSGGQPMQAYYMLKFGVPLGDSTYVLLAKFIIFQVSLTFLSAILLIWKLNFFSQKISGFSFLVFLGFIINFIVVIFLFMFAKSTRFSKKIVSSIINCLSKMKIIKNANERKEYFFNEIENVSVNIKQIKKQRKEVIISFFFTMLQLIVYYMVTYFIYLSFGLRGISPVIFIAAQSFVNLISAFIPLPGGSGGAEASFLVFYSILFSKEYISVAMLMWRMVTYYMAIIVSLIFLASFIGVTKKED